MASYIDTVLSKDEHVLHRGQVSYWSVFPLIVVGVLLLPVFFIGAILIVIAILRVISTELAVTNKRLIAKFGFISRETVELNIVRIESIQISQGLIGRIFNFGSLLMSGTGTTSAPIPGIANPLAFRNQFFEIQEQVRNGTVITKSEARTSPSAPERVVRVPEPVTPVQVEPARSESPKGVPRPGVRFACLKCDETVGEIDAFCGQCGAKLTA
jgi:uncharacterized membrane protein YdbT with pleckstrin-like domain